MSKLWHSRFVQWWLPIAIAIVLGGAVLIFGLKDMVGWYYQQTGMATLGGIVGFLVGTMELVVSLTMISAFVGCLFNSSNLNDRDSALAYFYIGAVLCWWPVIACWVATLTAPYDQNFATGLLEARFWVTACGFAAWIVWDISSSHFQAKSDEKSPA